MAPAGFPEPVVPPWKRLSICLSRSACSGVDLVRVRQRGPCTSRTAGRGVESAAAQASNGWRFPSSLGTFQIRGRAPQVGLAVLRQCALPGADRPSGRRPGAACAGHPATARGRPWGPAPTKSCRHVGRLECSGRPASRKRAASESTAPSFSRPAHRDGDRAALLVDQRQFAVHSFSWAANWPARSFLLLGSSGSGTEAGELLGGGTESIQRLLRGHDVHEARIIAHHLSRPELLESLRARVQGLNGSVGCRRPARPAATLFRAAGVPVRQRHGILQRLGVLVAIPGVIAVAEDEVKQRVEVQQRRRHVRVVGGGLHARGFNLEAHQFGHRRSGVGRPVLPRSQHFGSGRGRPPAPGCSPGTARDTPASVRPADLL